LGLPKFDPLNASFVHPAFDWARVKRGAQKIICFAGDNDPYVPLACSRDVADKAEVELVVVEKAGHLNAESGYRQFPLLLENILKDPS
jgi:predicted alpha/beta hydrolase family esterase